MPYIKKIQRKCIDHHLKAVSQYITCGGDLNYAVTRLMLLYNKLPISYHGMADTMSHVQEAIHEFRRRKLVPYEEKKIKENGDIY